MTKVLLLDWPTDECVVIVIETDIPKDDVDALVVPLLGSDGQPYDTVVGGWFDVTGNTPFDTYEAVMSVRKFLRGIRPSSPRGRVSQWVLANFNGTWMLGPMTPTGPRILCTEPVDLREGPPKADLELERD